jgi:minor extracellular serine protease Vpr
VTGQEGAQATYTLELNVSAAGPTTLPGQSAAPTDPDGDGRFEDINGDGAVNVIDVSVLLGAFDGVAAGEVTFYDFNDDEDLNILDVAALLDRT